MFYSPVDIFGDNIEITLVQPATYPLFFLLWVKFSSFVPSLAVYFYSILFL